MIVKVINRLNKRNFPSEVGNVPLPNPLEPGDIIEIVEEVCGTTSGDSSNDRWFKTDKGYFVWSGGTDTPSLNERLAGFSSLVETNWNQIADLELIEEYIKKYETDLIRDYEVDAVMTALKIKAGFHSDIPCLQFIVSNKGAIAAKPIPSKIPFEGKLIFTDVVEEKIPEIQSKRIGPGVKVSQVGSGESGTIGFKARRKTSNGYQYFFVSCYHVFCSKQLNKGVYEVLNPTNDNQISAKIDGTNVPIGKVVKGLFDESIPMDASIAEIFDTINTTIHPPLYQDVPKKNTFTITSEDIRLKTEVFGHGAVSGSEMIGIVIGKTINRSIRLNGNLVKFSEIIPISKMSLDGDSGTVVFEKQTGKIVGLVFAGGEEFSYLIPINKILYHLQIEIDYGNPT